MVGHVAEHPVGVAERGVDDSLALGVARVGAVGGADALRAVDHGEDAARFEQDGVRGNPWSSGRGCGWGPSVPGKV